MLNTGTLYYDRMRSSVGDKARMFPYIAGGNIVDVGGGDGSLLAALIDSHPDLAREVTNFDASHTSLKRSWNCGVPAVKGYADEIERFFAPESVDTILASAVVHEIFSYGNHHRGQKPGQVSNVHDFFEGASHVLRKKGRLIVRDGIHPGDTQGRLHLPADAVEEMDRFLFWSPFIGKKAEGKDRSIEIHEEGDGEYSGSLSSLMEFLFTYTWGADSFEREVQEFYGVFTLPELSAIAAQYGFVTVHAESYVQKGYVDNLSHISITPRFPDSNAMWVFEKQ